MMQHRSTTRGRILLLAAAFTLAAPMASASPAPTTQAAASATHTEAMSQHEREKAIPEAFRGATPGAPIKVNYSDWSAILHAAVVVAGRSDRGYTPSEPPVFGSHFRNGDFKSFRDEGNRIDFLEIKGKVLDAVSRIRKELEKLPSEVPLYAWSKDEQLAYWLNLYNITVVEQIARHYPLRRLRKLKFGKDSPWDEKLLHVAGVPLSLSDIRHILVTKWTSTLVIYGMFQGYVGGPSIPNEAYTGKNVHDLLLENAREFVNSNRGVMVRGDTLRVSDFYKHNGDLFPDWHRDLHRHLTELSDSDWRARVSAARRITTGTHDYYIADVFGGGMVPQSGVNDNPAAFVDARVLGSNISGSGMFGTVKGDLNINAQDKRFPVSAMSYIHKVWKAKTLRGGNVTLEEIDDSAKAKRATGTEAAQKSDTKADTGSPE